MDWLEGGSGTLDMEDTPNLPFLSSATLLQAAACGFRDNYISRLSTVQSEHMFCLIAFCKKSLSASNFLPCSIPHVSLFGAKHFPLLSYISFCRFVAKSNNQSCVLFLKQVINCCMACVYFINFLSFCSSFLHHNSDFPHKSMINLSVGPLEEQFAIYNGCCCYYQQVFGKLYTAVVLKQGL